MCFLPIIFRYMILTNKKAAVVTSSLLSILTISPSMNWSEKHLASREGMRLEMFGQKVVDGSTGALNEESCLSELLLHRLSEECSCVKLLSDKSMDRTSLFCPALFASTNFFRVICRCYPNPHLKQRVLFPNEV